LVGSLPLFSPSSACGVGSGVRDFGVKTFGYTEMLPIDLGLMSFYLGGPRQPPAWLVYRWGAGLVFNSPYFRCVSWFSVEHLLGPRRFGIYFFSGPRVQTLPFSPSFRVFLPLLLRAPALSLFFIFKLIPASSLYLFPPPVVFGVDLPLLLSLRRRLSSRHGTGAGFPSGLSSFFRPPLPDFLFIPCVPPTYSPVFCLVCFFLSTGIRSSTPTRFFFFCWLPKIYVRPCFPGHPTVRCFFSPCFPPIPSSPALRADPDPQGDVLRRFKTRSWDLVAFSIFLAPRRSLIRIPIAEGFDRAPGGVRYP